MTCYQRHMAWLFEALGEPMEKERKRAVHAALTDALGLPQDATCSAVWAATKERYGIDAHAQSAELIADVSERLVTND